MPKGSVHVEQVWKKFRADRTAPLFYDQLLRARRSLSKGSEKPYRWVLKDVSVDVEPGGTLGLIGINGSGKTTLLKIISGTTYQSMPAEIPTPPTLTPTPMPPPVIPRLPER